MNKKIFFSWMFLAVLLITVTSCNKSLSLQPQDGITRQSFWQTKEQVQSAVIGCYASLLGDPAGKDKPLSEYLFLWGELRGDMIAPGIGATNDEQDVMNVNTLPTNTVTNWAAVYRTINYCNTIVDFAPAVLNTDNTFTQTQLNAYLSEARALRALMYFYLVRSFRDVPLKLKSTSSDADLIQLPKTSADTVLKQIVADLNFADSNAALTYGSSYYDKGRITKYTVKAIKADVDLWMDNYTDAVANCDYIINSGQFGLIANSSGWFNTLYYQGNSNESIFEFQFDNQKLNSFYAMFTTSRQRFLASPIVMDEIYTIDPNNDQNFDIRGGGASVRTSDNTIWKYLGVNSSVMRTIDASYAHWFVYRYADILLMKAEALNQIGGRGDEALALVNTIRARANALDATNTNPDPTDKNALGDYILQERAREFSFEGKRWYDVLRNAKRNNYARLDILLNMVAKAVPANRQQSAISKYRDPNSHYFPIYYNELQLDPNLVQNPFYK
ncbi:MAG: RagB/SusD family nutrient uptake outer membrane protein [Bacteroidota bacterium]|nr:RagB/SusD family nutrient uptake outer membrane protein [Bacteroidota bacterium]